MEFYLEMDSKKIGDRKFVNQKEKFISQEDLPLLLKKIAEERFSRLGFEDISAMLFPKLQKLSSPFLLFGVKEAVCRILSAIESRESICIYGDFDLDGISSTALLVKALQAFGADVSYFIPRKGIEGYGITAKGLGKCFDKNGICDLLIAVDCGTNSLVEVDWLRDNGVETIILDHHCLLGKVPNAILVNPQVSGKEFNYLSAVGIVFKIVHGLLKEKPLSHFILREELPLVALGTLSDIVPLVKENRILVSHGIAELKKTKQNGLVLFASKAGEKSQEFAYIPFFLSPRLNATGRMDMAEIAVEILLSKTEQKAIPLLAKIEECNTKRREYQQAIIEEIKGRQEKIESISALVQVGKDWHLGVLGLVASYFSQHWKIPAFILSEKEDGTLAGSGRSVLGFSLIDLIQDCQDLLLHGGGHSMAVGISLLPENLSKFQERVFAFAKNQKREENLVPFDKEIKLHQLSPDFLSSYDLLFPFGKENPEPLFLARGILLEGEMIALKGGHWKFHLRQGEEIREALFFNPPDFLPPTPWKIHFHLKENVFRGKKTYQISIVDLQAD